MHTVLVVFHFVGHKMWGLKLLCRRFKLSNSSISLKQEALVGRKIPPRPDPFHGDKDAAKVGARHSLVKTFQSFLWRWMKMRCIWGSNKKQMASYSMPFLFIYSYINIPVQHNKQTTKIYNKFIFIILLFMIQALQRLVMWRTGRTSLSVTSIIDGNIQDDYCNSSDILLTTRF